MRGGGARRTQDQMASFSVSRSTAENPGHAGRGTPRLWALNLRSKSDAPHRNDPNADADWLSGVASYGGIIFKDNAVFHEATLPGT